MAAGEDDSSRNGDVEAFLSSYAASGDDAYGAARAVLERLQSPATRADARRLLGAVRRRLAGDPAAGQEEEECFLAFSLRIRDVALDAHLQGSQQRKKLTMMEIPSVFVPGDLFVTLYEGINHHPDPDSIFRNKTVAQLGCGNGWITIALAEKWCPSKEIIYGSTCLTLFNKLVLCCMREQRRLPFPHGHYVSAAKFMNAKTLTIPTNVGSGFKIEPAALRAALDDAYENEKVHWPWVYISGPTVNPSGSLYSDDEIKDLLSVCAEHGARVVIDTSFSGLEFQTRDGWSLWNLDSFSYNIGLYLALHVFMLGELSLQLTMSGFDFGFMIYNDPCPQYPDLVRSNSRDFVGSLIKSLVKHIFTSLSRPHRTLKYTFRKLLCLKNKRDQRISDLIKEQKETLKNHADKLTKTLKSCGWDVVGCHGGISMLAKPTAYIGKSFKMDTFEGELDGCNIREALLRSTGPCISSSKWTGIPDYCQFSFALESGKFDQAMDCITWFRELVLVGNAQMNFSSS